MMALETLKRTNFREEAVQVIRGAILGGELEPGSIHSAVSLAQRLGVSPTPVREAMLDLANAGLVEAVPNVGFKVTTISEQDLDEICELRVMLEVPALERVASRASTTDLDELGKHLAELESAAAAGDLSAFLAADRAFHMSLLELTGNRRLVRIVGELRDQTRITGLRALAAAKALESSAPEHRPILDALRGGDVIAAQRLLQLHLEHTRGVWAGRTEPEPPATEPKRA